jgi:MFS family permease
MINLLHRVAIVVVVLSLMAILVGAGASPTGPAPIPTASLPGQVLTLHDQTEQLKTLPRAVGLITLFLAIFPLFFGWKLIRWVMALNTAAIIGTAVLSACLPAWSPALAWTAAISAGLIGGVAGWFLYQALIAIQGALLGGVILVAAAQTIAPSLAVLAIILGVLGAVLGLVLGWRAAPYLGIIVSVLTGAGLAMAGMITLCRPDHGTQQLLLMILTAIVTILPGLVVQLRQLRVEP